MRRNMVSSAWLVLCGAIAGLLGATSADAATYYVSDSTGSDDYTAGQAQGIGTPWKTIQRAANNMAAGDTCLIRAGVYRETVTVPVPGAANSPIAFQAYNGETVVISGAESLTDWVQESGNIYYTTNMNWSLGDGNQVFTNGVMVPEARWPNAGPEYPWQRFYSGSPDWAYIDTNGTNPCDWFTDAALPSKPDGYWNGCLIYCLSGYKWWVETATATNYVDAERKVMTDHTSSDYNRFSAGDEYYLTGKKEEMDSAGEWYYDAANARLYIYSQGAPSGVEAKKRMYGFSVTNASFTHLVDLDFFGCTIETSLGWMMGPTNCVFDGLNMKYLNHDRKGVTGYGSFGLFLHNGDVLRNSELAFNSGWLLWLMGSDIRVINNHIHDAGYLTSGRLIYGAGCGGGGRNLISHNTLHDSGGPIIDGGGGFASIVEYNDMYRSAKLACDSGMLHASSSDGAPSIFRHNLMHDAPGIYGGGAEGFYLDCNNANWIVHHNIIWNIADYAIILNNRQNFHMVFNNTCWNDAYAAVSGFNWNNDGKSGTRILNNLFNGSLSSIGGATDIRYNFYTDPLFVNPSAGNFQFQAGSPAIDKAVTIPGFNDAYVGAGPDMGALEYGGTDWTTNCGCHATPPSPDPVYVIPEMIFANQVKNGGFEMFSAEGWSITPGSVAGLLCGYSWSELRVRTGYMSLELGVGTPEVDQVVTNLLPGRRYELYGALQTSNSLATAKLGVRDYGSAAVETNAIADGLWHMHNLVFHTGATNTEQAKLYIAATIPSGVSVYADDFSIELSPMTAPVTPPSDITCLLPNLASYWTMGEAAWNGTAAEARDIVGGNHGQAVGGANTIAGGNIGRCGDFDGVDDCVSVPDNASLQFTENSAFSIAFWFKGACGANAPYNFGEMLNKRLAGGCMIGMYNTGKIVIELASNSNAIDVESPSAYDDGAWHHVGYVYYGGVLKLYMDGQFVGEDYAALSGVNTAGAHLSIGAGWYGAFDGLIDEVGIWNRALSDSEVLGLYTSPSFYCDDPDGDGLNNLQEYQHGTDPYKADTDEDGLADGVEVAFWEDPCVSNNYSRLPFNEYFEPDTCAIGDIDGQHNWECNLTNTAVVQTNIVYEGNQALVMSVSNRFLPTVRHIFVCTNNVVWNDVTITAKAGDPSADPDPSTDPTGNAATMYFNDAGRLVVYDGLVANWVALSNVGPFAATNWVRLTTKVDYNLQRWSVYVNGGLAAAELGFGSNRTAFVALTLHGGQNHVDNVRIGADMPNGIGPLTVNLTAPTNGAAYLLPASITWTATVENTIGTITNVSFYTNGAFCATGQAVSATVFTNVWKPVAGLYALLAKGWDSYGANGTSAVNTIIAWTNQDIGNVVKPGNGAYTNGTFTVVGAGADIWGNVDAFRFVYLPLAGSNCTLIARVATMSNPNAWAKAGVMIRKSLAANAVNALVAVTPTTANGTTWQYRASDGGTSTKNANTTGITVPRWVKLVRSGDSFTAYQSTTNTSWTAIGTAVTLANMGTNTFVGLALTSHTTFRTCTGTFDNVSITTP